MAETAPVFRENLGRVLAWPLLAVAVALIGWHILFAQLESQRLTIENDALRDAEILADGYAEQVLRSVDNVEQAAQYIKYQWQATGGKVHLGHVDEEGLFLHSSRLLVSVIDPTGNVLTSSGPASISPHVSNLILDRVRVGLPVHFLLDEMRIGGRISPRHRLLFAWDLTDPDGKFAAAVIVAVDPAYFTAGHGDAVYKQNGLLAIVGDDGGTRAVRSESRWATVWQPDFVHAPRLNTASGSALVRGAEWFADQRDRIVGWELVERRGVNALIGFDYETVLAPYYATRETRIRGAAFATVALALFALLASMNALRLARRDHELQLIRTTYRMATEASNEGFYMLRPQRDGTGAVADFEVTDCNRRAAELVARAPHELVGRTIGELYAGRALVERLDSLRRAMETGYQEVDLQADGAGYPSAWEHLKLVRYGGNLAVSVRDITRERAHADELLRRSNEDPLTRLPNRYWVEGHLADAIARAERDEAKFALLFIDLDGFKSINDTWGHAAGDELLCTAAHRLREAVRPHDCVTRFGGDEFVIVLESIGEAYDAAQVSERILRAFRQNIRMSYGEYVIGASIGISMFPADGKDGRTLLQNADIAMYSVKSDARGTYRFFDEQFHEQLKARMARICELRYALAHDQFVVYYEPRVRLADGTLASLEALVRWAHPTRGLVPPSDFIGLVEDSGLVMRLGELVIDKVCAQLARWRRGAGELVPVSVNISPRQFNETDVGATLRLALERHNVPPALIEVELTESSVMNDTASVVEAIHAIRRAGIKVLLDDFGTGYSSLSQLYRLNFDGLKIDRAFVLQLGNAEGGTVIVRAIVTMARALGMRVVAEGVDAQEQVALLRTLGCDEIQGYLISRPLPPGLAQPVVRNFVLMD